MTRAKSVFVRFRSAIAVVAFGLGTYQTSNAQSLSACEPVPGEYLVTIREQSLPMVLSQRGRQKRAPQVLSAQGDWELKRDFADISPVLYSVRSRGAAASPASLHMNKDVLTVEPNCRRRLVKGVVSNPVARAKVGLRSRSPNDTHFKKLYGMSSVGAPAAWARTTGSSSIVVGILDTGIDINHRDIRDNLWVNPGEVADDGIDNDGNGLVDDVNGWNFAEGSNDVRDQDGHGTHVSGTVGAVGNNRLGVSGVNWNVKLVALRIFSGDETTTEIEVAGLNYAAEMVRAGVNLRVINASIGGGGACTSSERLALLELNSLGVTFVAAAGNEASNNDRVQTSPANCNAPNVISVAAIDQKNRLASFSNYGRTRVSVAAPGVSILSTYPDDHLAYLSGTSMAAPHVAGAAALLLSVAPTLTPAQVKSRLIGTCERTNALRSRVACGGKIRVDKAITAAIRRQRYRR